MDSERWRECWNLAPGVTYLNHGSFGPPPRPVRESRRAWQDELDRQPMEFYCASCHKWLSAPCHLYNVRDDIDRLVVALDRLLQDE